MSRSGSSSYQKSVRWSVLETKPDAPLTIICPYDSPFSNTGVMGGHLRKIPTFIINFRLPWGVLLFYNEIPERFLPFVKAG